MLRPEFHTTVNSSQEEIFELDHIYGVSCKICGDELSRYALRYAFDCVLKVKLLTALDDPWCEARLGDAA